MEYTVMLAVLKIKLVCASVCLVRIQDTLAHLDVRYCKFIPLLPYIQPSKETNQFSTNLGVTSWGDTKPFPKRAATNIMCRCT
jgi:hypothetical protein